jgi:hypothetical protein
MTHAEFEHLWLTGFRGQRTPADYRDELLCSAFDEGTQKLWECWSEAEKFFPYEDAAGTLAIAARAIERLLDHELAELVIEVGVDPGGLAPERGIELLQRRSTWIPHPESPSLRITTDGIADLKQRRLIREPGDDGPSSAELEDDPARCGLNVLEFGPTGRATTGRCAPGPE